MSKLYIFDAACKLVRKYGTRDPLRIIKESGAILKYSDRYEKLKGYYFNSLRSHYIVINSKLPPDERRIVAAHELGHYVLHRELAREAPISDSAMFTVARRHEYEANIFCAELLLDDDDVCSAAKDTDGDFFAVSSRLRVLPELLLFKMYSMNSRGWHFRLPFSLDSAFLKEKA
ncbi:MAG: ImmA/IrrE family metallo-endopeptidase [Eubacteriales bacterium]